MITVVIKIYPDVFNMNIKFDYFACSLYILRWNWGVFSSKAAEGSYVNHTHTTRCLALHFNTSYFIVFFKHMHWIISHHILQSGACQCEVAMTTPSVLSPPTPLFPHHHHHLLLLLHGYKQDGGKVKRGKKQFGGSDNDGGVRRRRGERRRRGDEEERRRRRRKNSPKK